MHHPQAVLKPGMVSTGKHFMAVSKLLQVLQPFEDGGVDDLVGEWAQLQEDGGVNQSRLWGAARV